MKKRIIIIEGADSVGKSQLSNHIQKMVNGKCHVLHSNYNKNLPQENNRRQHTLYTKFALANFKDSNYTGNNTVIFDRCYVSDITYGQIGYGSRGTLEEKYKHLGHLFKLMTSNRNVEVSFIYCRPNKSKFNRDVKEELLTDTENNKMQKIYDSVCYESYFQDLLKIYDIDFYTYSFDYDSSYRLLDEHFNF